MSKTTEQDNTSGRADAKEQFGIEDAERLGYLEAKEQFAESGVFTSGRTWENNPELNEAYDRGVNRAQPDPIQELANRIHGKVMTQREQILKAFIAQFGCPPSEIIQCFGQFGETFLRRMTPKEVALRDQLGITADETCDLRETVEQLRGANMMLTEHSNRQVEKIGQLTAERDAALAKLAEIAEMVATK